MSLQCVWYASFETRATFKENLVIALKNDAQEPVLSSKAWPFYDSPAASDKIARAQVQSFSEGLDIKLENVGWANFHPKSTSGHAVVVGRRSMTGNSMLHIKDSNHERPWFVENIDVMIPLDEVRYLLFDLALWASVKRGCVTPAAGFGQTSVYHLDTCAYQS
jgi:hypothetical protein